MKTFNNEVKQKMDELKQSPLFAISLSGKELFHSNFWAWLLEQKSNDGKNPYIEVFIPDFYRNGYDLIAVEREKNKMDLYVTYSKKNGIKSVLVIENKIKSMPTIEQLEKYENQLKKNHHFGNGVLTGLKETLNIEELHNWHFLSYKEIANRILEIKDKNSEMRYTEYIEQYAQDIICLDYIFENKFEESKDKYVYVDSDLEEIRFSDILIKMKGSEFVDTLNNCLKDMNDELVVDGYWSVPIAEFSFNNKKPTVTIVYKELKENKVSNEYGRIGVQIEGNQFRIYGGGSKFGINNEDEVYLRLNKYNYLDSKFKEKIRANGYVTRMRKDYCKYGGKSSDDYCHIYQYWNIEKDDYDELVTEIITQIKIAKLKIGDGLTFKK
ncbi:PD-(D/E)XK nuclease family protein [Vagococcus lutrae]|uniref:PD-(D/E)XK nuclease family protein n=1 Tax=Vagococcus lutrae TaxID=81947 RepID=UPI002096A34D|nr:PD-(D/E)XK nuclease family protein [Vagococcus lutrae]MCO7151759.1 PD-(D/E)XK nuclease family protein [Vagococcus lutrae]MDT2819465.1 PD-(D/E)XK nuclease family protein [Vagococcus lutrae]MDT2844326.1 PD-(D/E)XK nuclease family protein [Vagococcus lutrae]WCG04352.1 PD-(D/E)XK nuclease family protein [Vagococcus lutrae]